MKKVLFSVGCFLTIGIYIQHIDDPLNAFFSFLIAGIIPGTNIMLGLWPSLLIALVILLIARRFLSHIRFKLLEKTANQITEDKLRAEFKASNDATFDKTQRSVVAAPNQKPVS